MLRFSGTNVLLTGAASGIGRATALRLASEGAAVFGVDRDPAGLEELVRSAAGPGRIVTGVADITDEDAVAAVVDAAAEQLGGIDALINVAGTHRTTPIATLSVDDLRFVYEVNLIGTALFCREALRHLPDNGGVIVNVSSASATQGNPYMTAYSASKGAVLGFTLSLAAEVIGRGIRVLAVSPGQVATPLTAGSVPADLDMRYFARIVSPLGAGQPDQIAGTIAYAASRDASYMTGVELRVDGGSRI